MMVADGGLGYGHHLGPVMIDRSAGKIGDLDARRGDAGLSILVWRSQPVAATQTLNLSAGVSNCKVSRGRSFS